MYKQYNYSKTGLILYMLLYKFMGLFYLFTGVFQIAIVFCDLKYCFPDQKCLKTESITMVWINEKAVKINIKLDSNISFVDNWENGAMAGEKKIWYCSWGLGERGCV